MRIQPFKCLDKSDGANANGTALDMLGCTEFGFEVRASGTLAGSVQVEMSVTGDADTYKAYGAAQTVSAGATVVFDQNVMGSGWGRVGLRYARLAWTKTGGTGGVVGYGMAKGNT